MSQKNLNDENFGTRDKRGHWKPFGTISINPPRDIFFNPLKLLKYFFSLGNSLHEHHHKILEMHSLFHFVI